MPLTAAERAKNYRDRVKQKTAKYLDIKRKDCERKAQKRASMNMKEKEIFLESHRKAQRVYRRKVKGQDNKKKDANRPLYSKHTLAKAVKRVVRVLPGDRDRQQAVVKRIGQSLCLFGKPKCKRSQPNLSEAVRNQIFDFYMNDSISWQAPGKRDCLTVRQNGIRVQHQKRFLLFNIRETHALFVQKHPGMRQYILCKNFEDQCSKVQAHAPERTGRACASIGKSAEAASTFS